jgi:hypothetical protein
MRQEAFGTPLAKPPASRGPSARESRAGCSLSAIPRGRGSEVDDGLVTCRWLPPYGEVAVPDPPVADVAQREGPTAAGLLGVISPSGRGSLPQARRARSVRFYLSS